MANFRRPGAVVVAAIATGIAMKPTWPMLE